MLHYVESGRLVLLTLMQQKQMVVTRLLTLTFLVRAGLYPLLFVMIKPRRLE